jgi:hypothetical protein
VLIECAIILLEIKKGMVLNMLTAQEMLNVLEFKLKVYNELHKKYSKISLEEGESHWKTMVNSIEDALMVLGNLYKDFTGKEYKFKEE